MTTNKTVLKSICGLCFFIAVSGLYLLYSNSLVNNICALLVLSIGAAFVVGFDLLHPFVWYSCFFTLYAIGYPILLHFDVSPVNYGYTKELMALHWTALVTFLIVVNPRSVDIADIRSNLKSSDCKVSKQVFYGLSVALVVFTLYLRTKGFVSKGDIGASDSVIIFIGMRLVLVYILITSLEIIKTICRLNRFDFKVSSIAFVIIAILMIYSAERDLLLRFILILFFLYYVFFYKKKHFVKLAGTLLIMFALVPISRSIKYFGMRGELQAITGNPFFEFITSEFHTEARNVQLLLNSGVYEGYFNGSTIVSSISNLLGVSDFSLTLWFHKTFYPNSSTGMGFSLVGEGYVNMGYFGVVIVFAIIGLLVKNAYRNSNKSIYSLVVYLMLIPISIYTLRADLNNFMSQYVKQVLFIILMLKLMDVVLLSHSKKRVVRKDEI